MAEIINEEVSVDLVFDCKTKTSLPWVVKWRGRVYKIDKIGLHHCSRVGRDLIHFFSVCAKETFFKLSFNTTSLHWKLEEVAG